MEEAGSKSLDWIPRGLPIGEHLPHLGSTLKTIVVTRDVMSNEDETFDGRIESLQALASAEGIGNRL